MLLLGHMALLCLLEANPYVHGTAFCTYHLSRLQTLEDTVKKLKADPESAKKNRIGVLLGTEQTQTTKTLTHVLWALFNVLPAKSVQKPHRHTATALDMAVYAPEGPHPGC